MPRLVEIIGGPREPDTAVEILREFSATELVGKLFHKGATGNWLQMTLPGVSNYEWYKDFLAMKSVHLIIKGSHPWQVLFFRPESDETGSYVAVGLRLHLHTRS